MRFRFPGDRIALVAALALVAAACDQLPTDTKSPLADAGHAVSTSPKAVLIGFTATPGSAGVALVESLGGTVTHQFRYVPVLAATIPAASEAVLAADPSVAYVEADGTFEPLGGKQITDWGVSKIESEAVWALGYRGQGVKVGVFDSGIDIDHPDLRVAGGIDLVGDGRGLDDCNGHGTHVAGIVGATRNGHHTVGVAPRAELYSMRFADCAWAGATFAKMIQGLEWAIDNGMHVINMSFGATVPLPSASVEAALDAAYARGIVLIAASGNGSTPAVGLPAGYASVIAVGATDDADNLATFSQWGTEQELTAPGVNNLASYMVGLGQETTLTVDTDAGHELEAIAMAFAGRTSKKGLTAEAVFAGFGTPVEFESVSCAGRIAVASRGGTSFAEKAVAAMDAGCAALVIHNHTPGNFNGTLGTATAPDGRAWIPVVSISLEEGLYLRDQMQARRTVTTLLNIAGNLAILSGTSMASPHVAGVAALMLNKNPGLTPDQVRTILRGSAEDLGAPGWDPLFGYGRVNAKRAVQGS